MPDRDATRDRDAADGTPKAAASGPAKGAPNARPAGGASTPPPAQSSAPPAQSGATIAALLDEQREYPPAPDFTAQANLRDPAVYKQAAQDLEQFWAAQASGLDWFQKWSKVLEWSCPDAKWFVGGKLNVAYNCLDRHLRGPRRNKAAIVWVGEPGDRRTLTYWDLHREVNKFANGLRNLGVKKGDRVAIYMPMIPELPIAMLA